PGATWRYALRVFRSDGEERVRRDRRWAPRPRALRERRGRRSAFSPLGRERPRRSGFRGRAARVAQAPRVSPARECAAEAGTLARNGAWHGGGAPKAAGAASGARPRGGGEEKR